MRFPSQPHRLFRRRCDGMSMPDRRWTSGDQARDRRARVLNVETLEDRTLLAALQFTAGLGEHSTLDSVVQSANYLSNVNNPGTQKFTHNDGTAVSNVTLTTGASTTGNPGVNLDILSQGSVAKHGIANVAVNAGVSDASGTIGPTVNVPVTIVATEASEAAGDPVNVQFSFAFNVKAFASNNAVAVLSYAASYTYMGTTTSLASKEDNLGGSGITPIGAPPVDNETGTLHAHIGDTFTLSFSENLAGNTIAPYLGAGLNNVGWLIDTTLDASISSPAAITAQIPTWASSDGGVDYGYTISADLPQATTVDLDWASGTTVDTVIGNPITSTTTETAQGTYNLHATPAQLGTPPAGAKDLLVVVDPNNTVSPADPSKATALALSDISIASLAWSPTNDGVDYSYQISNAELPSATTIGFYWAPDQTFDESKDTPAFAPVTTSTTMSTTPYSGHLAPTDVTNPIPFGTKYFLAVANPDHDAITVADPDAVQSVQSPPEVVNVITHGFDPSLGTSGSFLTPFQNIATDLDTIVPAGTPLQGSVRSYVPQWNSYGGWYQALAALAVYEVSSDSRTKQLALATANDYLSQAAANAQQAAQNIVAYITKSANGYLSAPQYGQVIQLIGHSRGAAVNALVSQILEQQDKYDVDDFISLDGYSTDWPAPSNILEDINITATATADTKINYEVQEGLGPVLAELVLPNWIGQAIPQNDLELLDALTNWRAPDRSGAGFENEVIPGTGVVGDPDMLSNHINIDTLYYNNGSYFSDNTEGDLIDSMGSDAVTADASPAAAPTATNFSNFTDGSFAMAGSILSQSQSANINAGGDPLVSYWLGQADDPATLLAAEWNVTGNAQLVQDGNNTLAQLTAAPGNTSIGQYLELDSQASSIGFDMSVLSASPGDQLQVLVNNSVLGSFNLSTLSSDGHYTVPLTGYASQDGEVTFQLVGSTGDTAKIQLDNLAVNEANSPVTFDPIQPQAVVAGTSLLVPVTANDTNQGQTLTYTLDPGAPSGVTIDPITGDLTWNVPASEPAGNYSVLVSATDNNSPPATAMQSFTIVVITPTQPTSLSTVSGSGTYGGTATLTATLNEGGSPLPGETVSFTLNEGGTVTPVGTATTDANGVATLIGVSVAGFNSGTFTGAVGASFAGDSTDAGSSASGTLSVAQLEANLILGSSANPAVTGTPLSFSLTVSPTYDEPVPTGTVQFEVDGANLGAPVALVDGTADSGLDTTLGAGVYEITAVYSGDTNYADGSQGLAQTIVGSTLLTGATYTVNTLHDSGSPTGAGLSGDLRYAVTMADANPGSRIIFTVTGAIHLASSLPDLSADVTIDGPGTTVLTVDGSKSMSDLSIFTVDDGVTASISGLTITGGHGAFYSGGIKNTGSLTLTDCAITGNASSNGGGGVTNFGALTLADCTITGDTSTGDAGGVRNDGELTLTDCAINGNTGRIGGVFNSSNEGVANLTDCFISDNSGYYDAGVDNEESADGSSSMTLTDCTITGNSCRSFRSQGALVNGGGTMTVTGCTISDNSSQDGGGGIANSRTMTVTDCTISGNSTQQDGGGIENEGTLTVTDCTISGNSALPAELDHLNLRGGGGIYNDGTLTLNDSTISGNTTSGSGGGLLNDGKVLCDNSTFYGNSADVVGGSILNYNPRGLNGFVSLTNCTISGNRSGAKSGGGIYNYGYFYHGYYGPSSNGPMSYGDIILTNSLISGNISNTTSGDVEGPIDSKSANNLIGDGDSLTGISNGTQGNQIGSATSGSVINADLGPLAFNGGPTETMALLAGSPAIGAASLALAVDPTTNAPLTTDQRGPGFLRTSGNSIDIGAFQHRASPVTATKFVVAAQPPGMVNLYGDFGLSVMAEDSSGALDTSYSGPITVALANNPDGASLGGTLDATLINGVATFSGLTLNEVGAGFTLQVANGKLTPATTNALSVAPLAATHLVIATQPPGSIAADSSFGLVVNVEDALGNVASAFQGSVVLSLSSNPGSATLSGTLSVTAVNGVATFTGLTLDQTGDGYTLLATSNGLAVATTRALNVSPAVPTQLVIATQPPGSVAADSSFGLVVNIEDVLGNVASAFQGSVVLSLSSNPGSATLSGTLNVTAVNGVATFTGLTLDQTGDGYTLLATSNDLPVATTSAINVTPGAATQLVVQTQPPGSVVADTGFGLVVDADSGVAVDTSFNGTVSVQLSNGPAGALLGGTLSVTAVNGVATFAGLTLDQTGNGYALELSSDAYAATTTSGINVTPAPATQLVVQTQPPGSVVAGTGFGLVVDADSGVAVDTSFSGTVSVQLYDNPGGALLGGTLSVTAVNGVATFAGLTLDQTGNGYTLELSSDAYAATTTSGIDVTEPTVPIVPGAPQLAPQSDTGVSNSDGITRDNGSAGAPLTYTISGVSPSNGFAFLYDVTNATPLLLGSAQATNGTATITLSGGANLPLADGVHRIAATAASTSSSPQSALSGSTPITIQSSLTITATTPADGASVPALPNGQVTITFDHLLAGLTDGGPALGPNDPNALTLTPNNGPALALTTTYHVNANGTSSIVLTPVSPPAAAVQTLQVDSSAFTDLAGSSVSALSGGRFTFTVTGPADAPVTINPIPAQILAPGGALNVQVTVSDPDLGRTLVYSLGSGAPAGAAIDPRTGLFTWAPSLAQAGVTHGILVTVAVQGTPGVNDSKLLTITVLSPPQVTSVSTTQLHKGRVNKGTSTINIVFNEPMGSLAGASNFYAVETPIKVRIHKKITTKLVPVGFTSRSTGANSVSLTLLKPSKLHLTLIVRAGDSAANGLPLGHDDTFTVQ